MPSRYTKARTAQLGDNVRRSRIQAKGDSTITAKAFQRNKNSEKTNLPKIQRSHTLQGCSIKKKIGPARGLKINPRTLHSTK